MKRHLLLLFILLVAVRTASSPVLAQDVTPTETPTPTLTETPIFAPTETPSGTPTFAPTDTPTGTPTLTATPNLISCDNDEHEPNDNAGCVLANGLALTATIASQADVDQFFFFGKGGQLYQLEVVPDPASGLDPVLSVWDFGGVMLGENDDRAPGDLASLLSFLAPADGYYLIKVQARSVITGDYTIQVGDQLPTATPTASRTLPPTATLPIPTLTTTPTPAATATPLPGAQFEPNNTWLEAKDLMLGKGVNEAIIPDDVDWWAMRVKPGVTYQCAVTSKDFDPTIRIEREGYTVVLNDDQAPGKTDALVTWTAPHDGIDYAIVASTFGKGTYSLTCNTATASSASASSGAQIPVTSGGSGNSITDDGGKTAASSQTTTPTATAPTAEPRFYSLGPAFADKPLVTTIRLLVYYDLNNNKSPEPTEGVEGLSVRALSDGQFVGWTLTDTQGNCTLTVIGPVDRILIPFLNVQEDIKLGQTNTFTFRLKAVKLPTFLPVESSENE